MDTTSKEHKMTGTYGATWITKTGTEREGADFSTLDEAIASVPTSAVSWRVMSWEKRGVTWGAFVVAES